MKGKLRSFFGRFLQPSIIILTIANLIPIYGVLSLNWEVFPLLFLFWMENLIIGFINAIKMVMVAPGDGATWIMKLFFVPFFCFHYGIFTLVHGVFVFGFFGGGFTENAPFPTPDLVIKAIAEYDVIWAFLALLASHIVSFAVNYIGHGEYKTGKLQNLMQQPYGRVIVLHMTILGGGFLMAMLGSPSIGLILLMVLKIILDIRSHIKEHPVVYDAGSDSIKAVSSLP
jgi:hypothetical protein